MRDRAKGKNKAAKGNRVEQRWGCCLNLCFTDRMAFAQRLEGGEAGGHLISGKSKNKGIEWGLCLVPTGSSKVGHGEWGVRLELR